MAKSLSKSFCKWLLGSAFEEHPEKADVVVLSGTNHYEERNKQVIEEFEKQSAEYKASVLPKDVKARVCVEAATAHSWYKYAGDNGEILAMEGFGASAPAGQLFPLFGFTVENVVEKALTSLKNCQ